jgi:hypothetical protein
VSNLASAIFIPFFQVARDFAREGEDFQRPQYSFSFIMLMATHVIATVFFATFNGAYRRLEHEQERKKERESLKKIKSGEIDPVDEEQQTLLK